MADFKAGDKGASPIGDSSGPFCNRRVIGCSMSISLGGVADPDDNLFVSWCMAIGSTICVLSARCAPAWAGTTIPPPPRGTVPRGIVNALELARGFGRAVLTRPDVGGTREAIAETIGVALTVGAVITLSTTTPTG